MDRPMKLNAIIFKSDKRNYLYNTKGGIGWNRVLNELLAYSEVSITFFRKTSDWQDRPTGEPFFHSLL